MESVYLGLRHLFRFELMRWPFAINRKSISLSGRLYGIAIISIVMVALLVGASVYFADLTRRSTEALFSRGFVGVLNAARLELLLERHRRLVESAPSEVNRDALQRDKQELLRIEPQLREAINAAEGAVSQPNAPERKIRDSFPSLFALAEKVYFFALEFAQDRAVEYSTEYAALADSVQVYVRDYREQRIQESQSLISSVFNSAKRLTFWVVFGGIAAVVFIGPLGLATTRRVLTRLRNITRAMVLLARTETATQVPSREDRDEVGEMARAVEVFKENSLQLEAQIGR